MRILNILILWIALVGSVDAAIYTNAAGSAGRWTAGATWAGGTAPSADLDSVVITNGIVYYDADNSAMTYGWSNVVIQLNGQLIMTNAYGPWYFMIYSNVSGIGTWNVGTSNTPIGFTSSNTPGGIVKWSGAGTCSMTGTNKNNWYGTPALQHLWMSNSTPAGSISINLSNSAVVPNAGTNLVIWIGEPQTQGTLITNEYYVVSSVSGTVFNIQTNLAAINAITNYWPGLILTNLSTRIPLTNAPISILNCSVELLSARTNTCFSVPPKTNNMIGISFVTIGGISPTLYLPGWNILSNSIIQCKTAGSFAATYVGYNTINNSSRMFGGGAQCSSNIFNNYIENTSSGISSVTGSYMFVYNNWAYNISIGLLGDNTTSIILSNNIIINAFNGGLMSSSANEHRFNTMYNNTLINCIGGINYGGMYNCIVSNNLVIGGSFPLTQSASFKFYNNNISGNTFSNVSGIFNALTVSFFSNNIINNNTFNGCFNRLAVSGFNRSPVINNSFIGCSNLSMGNAFNYYFSGNTFQNCTNDYFGIVNSGNNVVFSGNTISNCVSFPLAYNSYGITISDTINLGTGGWPLTTNCFDAKLWNSPSTNDSKQLSVPYSTVSIDQSYWRSDFGTVIRTNNQYELTSTASNGPVPFSISLSVRPGATRVIELEAVSTNNCTYAASIVTGTGYPYNQQVFCTGTSGGTTNLTLTFQNNNPWPQLMTLWAEVNAISNTTGYIRVTHNKDIVNTVN